MKRQGLSIGVALVIGSVWTVSATAQSGVVNPLRRHVERAPAVAAREAPSEPPAAENVVPPPADMADTTDRGDRGDRPATSRTEPRRLPTTDAEPMRRVPRGQPRRTLAATRPQTPSPFRLLQFGVRVPPGRTSGRFASRLKEPPATATPAPSSAPSVSGEPELITPGMVVDEGTVIEGPQVGGVDCCGGVGCAQCGGVQCPSLRNFEFFAGTQGFTNQTNRGETGSFGFNYGFNWGAPLYCLTNGEIGMQAGFRGVTSNFDGASYSPETRNQYFITAGLFRRVDYGLQGGVVFDYLGESWYYNADMKQIRGEISWMFPACHEIGFWFAARGNDSINTSTIFQDNNATQLNERLVPVTQYRFFYRRRFEDCGAEGRLSAGWTSNGDGLVGADFQLPISDRWALETTFTYLIPDGDATTGAFAQEAWNVAFGLVWYPGIRNARANDYFRPLFDVADNGSFILAR